MQHYQEILSNAGDTAIMGSWAIQKYMEIAIKILLFQWNRFPLISKAYTCDVLQMMIRLGNYVLRLRNFSGRLVLTIE